MSIQRALVIGAGSGVGQATAGALTAAGPHIKHVQVSGTDRGARRQLAVHPLPGPALVSERPMLGQTMPGIERQNFIDEYAPFGGIRCLFRSSEPPDRQRG